MGIPKEYDEAAIIEGGLFHDLVGASSCRFPKRALGVVAIMSFIYHWKRVPRRR